MGEAKGYDGSRRRLDALSGGAWITGLVVACWLLAFHAAALLEYHGTASLWYPPAAVSFAAFVVFRWRAWPAVVLANLWASRQTLIADGAGFDASHTLVAGLGYALAHGVPYWILGECVLRSIPRSHAASALPRTVATFLIAGLLAAVTAAGASAWVTSALGLLSRDGIWPLTLPLLVGDYTGLVALGPLLVLAFRAVADRLAIRCPHRLHAFDDVPRPLRNPFGLLMKLLLVLGASALSLLAMAAMPANQPLLFLISVAIVLQLWIVHTQGATESLISVGVFSLMLVVLVRVLQLIDHALVLQFAMVTLAAGSYFGMAVPNLYADNARLRRLLIQDALTGAYNRHFFVEMSEKAIEQSRTRGEPVSMLMIDLDNLKDINDRHGHAAGDHALSLVVRVCMEALGGKDLLGRLGGDEFCVLLPGSDAARAAQTAERLLAAVRAARYTFLTDLRPSLSIGVATVQDSGEDYESLWLRADSALYVAKRSGRDRIAQEEGC
jgi:diguanylate cyclase (GGDEF)-like protein